MPHAPLSHTLRLLAAAVAAALLLSACGPDPRPEPPAPGALRVVVSLPPLAGLIEPLLPEGSELTILVGPGQSEHGFELTPAQVAATRRADLVAIVGLGLDTQVERAIGRAPADQRLLRFADIVDIDVGDHDHAEHDHEHHDHGPIDPHLWLDPELARQFVIGTAAEIEAALGGPPMTDQETPTQRARAELAQRITELDDTYRQRLAPFEGASIINTHDAFGRLAERYGLRIGAVIQPIGAREPTMASLTAAADAARESGARAIFIEPQAPSAAARRLADITGLPVGTLDPLGDGDWFAMMESNLDELVRALSESAP